MPHDIMAGMQPLATSPMFSVTRSEIFISADPEDREVYKTGSTRKKGKFVDLYAIAKVGIDRLMNAAGIEELSSKTEKTDERVWVAEFTGKYVRPDGTEVKLTGTKEVDLAIGSPRWEAEYGKHMVSLLYEEAPKFDVKQAGRWEDVAIEVQRRMERDNPERLGELNYIADAKATHAINNAAKFGRELAETGARLRAVRSIMQIGTYLKEELEEPFIIYSARFDWDKMQAMLPASSVQKLMTAHVAKTLGIDLDKVVQIPDSVEEREEGAVIDVDFTEVASEEVPEAGETIVEQPEVQEDPASQEELERVLGDLGKSLEEVTKSVFGEEMSEVDNNQAEIIIQYVGILTDQKEKGIGGGQLRSVGAALKREIRRAMDEGDDPDFEGVLNGDN